MALKATFFILFFYYKKHFFIMLYISGTGDLKYKIKIY